MGNWCSVEEKKVFDPLLILHVCHWQRNDQSIIWMVGLFEQWELFLRNVFFKIPPKIPNVCYSVRTKTADVLLVHILDTCLYA